MGEGCRESGSDQQQLQSVTMEILPSASCPLKNNSLLLKTLLYTDAPSSCSLHPSMESVSDGPVVLAPQYLSTWHLAHCLAQEWCVDIPMPCEGELPCPFLLQCNLETASGLAGGPSRFFNEIFGEQQVQLVFPKCSFIGIRLLVIYF